MATQKESPYICHILVCTNDRGGERKSCADNNSPSIRTAIKKGVGERGWKGKVRVSLTGCMGLCAKGPNVMLYPQKIWFSDVSTDDVGEILSKVEEIVEENV